MALRDFLIGTIVGFGFAAIVLTTVGREVTAVVARSTGKRLAREIKG